MTPEEQALLSMKLSASPVDAATDAVAFANRLRGIVPSPGAVPGLIASGLRNHPTMGPLITGGQVAGGLMSDHQKDVLLRNTLPEDTPLNNALGLVRGGPDDLSAKARTTLANREEVTSPGGTLMRPAYTPDVNVEAAPTLDPKYGQSMKAAGAGGVGGGGGAGNGLKAQLDAARAAGLGTMGEERDMTGQLGADRAGRVMGVASIQEAEAARQQQAAEQQQRIDQEASTKHEAFLARNAELADEIGKMKTDPGRLMRNADAGTQMAIGIGSILGGALAAVNGGTNTSLDRLDRIIDRDIRSQEQEIDNKKTSLSARQSVFGQMLQETGDRRLAGQQTRLMMLEAAKLKIQADSDRLGIPEVRTNAEIATNAIQQKIDTARTGMAKEAYQTFLAQAAAAAAQRAAAEKLAWERSMEVTKLGFEKEKLDIERQKANGLSGEEIAKQTQQLGKDLGDKDFAEGRSAVDNVKRRIASAKPDEGLPGIGRAADLRDRLRPEGLNIINPFAQLANVVGGLSDQERVSRGDWEKIKLSYQKQITGSGASEGERKMISDAFEGAKSPAEQRNAIKQADDYFTRREAAIKAGYDPRAVAIFESRLQGLNPTLPSSVQVKK